jgi:dipeptidyl-peptidase 4
VKLDVMLIKPPTFDAARKYPVIVFAYTEPASTSADERWAGNPGMFRRVLAAEGYVVVAIREPWNPSPERSDVEKSGVWEYRGSRITRSG